MPWVWLFVAGLPEIVWAVVLKCSGGLSDPLFSFVAIAGVAASVCFLALPLKRLPLGTAYARWTGIGAIGMAISGIVLFKKPAGSVEFFCIALIMAGLKFLAG